MSSLFCDVKAFIKILKQIQGKKMILNFFVHFFVLLIEIKVKKKNRDWNILKISGILLVFLLATSTARLELQVIGFT